MRILVIPFEQLESSRTDVRFAPITQLLAKENHIIGVRRTPYFRSPVRFIRYAVEAFVFGLRHANNYDLILCEQPWHALIGAILSVATRKPCIWDSHGNMRRSCREMRKSKIYTALMLAAEKIAIRSAKLMIVPSEVDKKLYIEQGFKAEKMRVIPSGVSLSSVDEAAGDKADIRSRLGLDTNRRILTFVAKLTNLHNMEAAIWINDELAPAIAEELDDVQILIIGPGEIPPWVHPIVTFTGFVPDLYEYIHACDLSIAPLRLDSGMLTKVIEAMACAKPVMILPSAVDGVPQLVDGESAIIVEDRSAFIARTLDVLRNLHDVGKLGANARKIIEQHYNWEVIAEEWRRLVNEVVPETR